MKYKYRGIYVRKNGKRVISFYNFEIKKKKDVSFYFRERLRMKEKMENEGRKVYPLRKITLEPVYGNLEELQLKAEFVKITNAAFKESGPHGKMD